MKRVNQSSYGAHKSSRSVTQIIEPTSSDHARGDLFNLSINLDATQRCGRAITHEEFR